MTIRWLHVGPRLGITLVAVLGCSPAPGNAGDLIETTGSSDGPDSETEADATTADATTTGDGVDLAFCAGFADEVACAAAPPPAGASPFVHCQWIELTQLRIDEASATCAVEAPQASCVTVEDGTDPGCPSQPCAATWDVLLGDPRARVTDDGAIQAFSNLDELCSGAPVGDWLRATDPSFGACAFHCLGDDPCAMPFDVYVALRSTLSQAGAVDDCGALTAESAIEEWQAAHDCALQHVADGKGFRLVTLDDSAGSPSRDGYLALENVPYEVTLLHSDSDVPYEPSEQAGTGYQGIVDCVVGVGELCLEVTEPGAINPICEG